MFCLQVLAQQWFETRTPHHSQLPSLTPAMDSFRYLPPALVAVSACLALASALPSEYTVYSTQYTVHTLSVSRIEDANPL